MSHTDPEVLALRALGQSTGGPADDAHIAVCERCRAELAELAEVTALAGAGGGAGMQLEAPPPQVWARIAAAVADAAGADSAAGTNNSAGTDNSSVVPLSRHGTRPGRPGRRSWARRSRLAAGLAGLAAGLIIGVAAAAGIDHLSSPATAVVAQTGLHPLPEFPQWSGAVGTAVMQTTAAGRTIDVTLQAPAEPGFYEVWLLARNGVSMISLGDLDAAHTGSFVIPPGTDLGNYSRIDVSLQPFNGSTLHSRTSVVRGSLPAAALNSNPG